MHIGRILADYGHLFIYFTTNLLQLLFFFSSVQIAFADQLQYAAYCTLLRSAGTLQDTALHKLAGRNEMTPIYSSCLEVATKMEVIIQLLSRCFLSFMYL